MTQFKKEVANFRVNKLALAVALGLSLGLTGCGDDKGVSNAVGVPNPNALMPTGTIQGRLTDTVTNEPIVGAVVDIGIAKATTSETGQFVISNVPATTDSVTGTVGGAYQVTVDLRQVKVPTNGAKYPDFSYTTAAVNYTSLNDGSNDAAGTSSSNHDTPVTGLVAPINVKVGKLAAGIKGVVANNVTLAPVGAGYTVKLVSLGDVPNENSAVSGKGGTGALENVVATVTTDANGAFSFDKIESLRNFRIDAMSANGAELGQEAVRSPADGQVKTLLIQRAADAFPGPDLRTVFVATTDTLAPRVLKTTPENGSEIAPGSNVTVKFAFSEPIRQTAATRGLTASSPTTTSLYGLIGVNFLGAKAGNIAHSLSWNATFTELTVTIPTVAAASNYQVNLRPAADILQDEQGNNITFSTTDPTDGVVDFSTNGAITPKNVSTLRVPNSGTLDVGTDPILDWNAVSGAKSYNVYRAKSLTVAADGTATYGAFERIANVTTTDYTDNASSNDTGVILAPYTVVDFAENDVKVSYKYMVRPVSRDNVESVDTTGDVANTIEAQDVRNNAATIPSLTAGDTSVIVSFSEQMDKVSARNIANYVLTARADNPTTPVNEAPTTTPAFPALSSVVYNAVANTATLTYASGIPAGTTLTVNVKDIAGNSVVTGATATNTASVDKVNAVASVDGVALTASTISTTDPVTGVVTVTPITITTTTVSVFFDADVNATDAVITSHYTLAAPATTPAVANATVTSAALDPAGRRVILTLNGALNPSTTLTVTGVKGLFGTFADGISKLNF